MKFEKQSIQNEARDPVEIAQKQFGVDLNDPNAVMEKMRKMYKQAMKSGGKLDDYYLLSNLSWQNFELEQRRQHVQKIMSMSPARIEAIKDQLEFDELAFRVIAERKLQPILEERLSALNDQLEAKEMKLIPTEAAEKAISTLIEQLVINVKFQSSKTFMNFDIAKWAKELKEQAIFDKLLQKAI